MGWLAVDHHADPPEIKGGLRRSERAQAAYVTDVLAAFEALGLYAAHAFTFVCADSPHRSNDPRHDLDMASYALVKPIEARIGTTASASAWHWEPKRAFHAPAGAYRAAPHARRRA